MIYKITFSGVAFLEADDEAEAESDFLSDNTQNLYFEYHATSITESDRDTIEIYLFGGETE